MGRIGRATTIYIEHENYMKLRRLIAPKPISQEINEFVRRRVAELEGQPLAVIDADQYEYLKNRHNKLMKDAEALLKALEKVYDRFCDHANELRLDFDGYLNLDDVVPRLLGEASNEDTHHMHQFITLLEIAREVKEVEAKMADIRTSKEKLAGLRSKVAAPIPEEVNPVS